MEATLERIFETLKEKGIEQRVLAETIGIKPQTISDWKSGKNKSYKKYIGQIASFLDVSADYLLGRTEISEIKSNSEANVTTIEKIMHQLEQKGISPSKMMRDLGFSSGLFTQWKKGLQSPSKEKIKAIADYLGVSVDYLLNRTDSETKEQLTDVYLSFAKNAQDEGIDPDDIMLAIETIKAMRRKHEA